MAEPVFQNYSDAFSNNLRSLMEGRGMDGPTLASECGIPNASLNRYIHSVRVPKIDNVIILAKYFNVTVDWLLGLSDEKFDSWPPEIRDLVQRYTVASPHDKQIVDTALGKYKEE